MSEESQPLDVYRDRLADRKRNLERLQRSDSLCANGRFAIFVLALGILGLSLVAGLLPIYALAVPIIAFGIVAIIHDRTLRAKVLAEDAIAFYEKGIDRLEGLWPGRGPDGQELAPADHLYAEDLDLFGNASLFELLCTARTRAGESMLARWMCSPADPEEIEARHEAIKELRGQLDFRETLALAGGTLRTGVRPEMLSRWACAQPVLSQGARYTCAIALTALTVAAFAGWAADSWTLAPVLLFVTLELIFARTMKESVARVIAALQEPMKDLAVFANVARHFEEAAFISPKLKAIQAQLTADGKVASEQIGRLARLFTWLDAHRNQIFAPIAIVLMWTVHFAHALERWRKVCGNKVPDWLEAVGELEALSALACYAYERPGDIFPEIVEGEALYDGRGLGHPLLTDTECVRNSVSIGVRPRMLIVSGSNMSGKSTLLRVVGINAVLAFMGAPVRAESLRISPLAIGASLHIVDSIQSGTSHFYAEITRLRKISELARSGDAVLFLVDEILHGTNSHDRRIGAEAVLKSYLEAGGIGLVTTHDLAITDTAKAFAEKAANVHFVDHIEEGRLVFDYKVRDGVVQRSNALALMRAIGLDV